MGPRGLRPPSLDGEHRLLTMDMQEKLSCRVFNKLLPMSSDKSVTDVPGLDLAEPRPSGAVTSEIFTRTLTVAVRRNRHA